MTPALRGSALLLLALTGCPKQAAPPPIAPALLQDAALLPRVAGHVVDGEYTDGRFPLTLTLPPGWTAVVGEDDRPERLTLTSPDSYARVVIATLPEEQLQPRRMEGCSWTFTDTSRYRAPKVVGAILAATCTPDRPGDPRVLAYIRTHAGSTWHIEGTLTPGHLREAKAELDAVAGAVRFR